MLDDQYHLKPQDIGWNARLFPCEGATACLPYQGGGEVVMISKVGKKVGG